MSQTNDSHASATTPESCPTPAYTPLPSSGVRLKCSENALRALARETIDAAARDASAPHPWDLASYVFGEDAIVFSNLTQADLDEADPNSPGRLGVMMTRSTVLVPRELPVHERRAGLFYVTAARLAADRFDVPAESALEMGKALADYLEHPATIGKD